MLVAPYRLLIVANRGGPCPGLPGVVHRALDGRPAVVHVVAPMLIGWLHWAVSDTDGASIAADGCLTVAVDLLRASGLQTSGEVGDSNPMLAIEDALAVFHPDAVLIATRPHGACNWMERDLVRRARRRLDIAVHHAVSDFEIEPTDPVGPFGLAA